MNKAALASVVLGIVAAAPSAFAQSAPCPPGSWLCADITIGGSVSVTPPTVYVEPPPPPVVYVPPPPPPVHYYIAPAPVVVYQPPPPPPTYVLQQPQMVQTRMYYPIRPRESYVGIQGAIGGGFYGGPNSAGMPVIGLGLRARTRGHWGVELALNGAAGVDYNGDGRVELPLTASGLFYFNPENRFQFYGLAGLGVSLAAVSYNDANRVLRGREGAEYAYFGGHVGLGAEWQLSQSFSLFADVRGFLRTRIDDGTANNPEFVRFARSGAPQTSNSSVGVLGQLGGVFYF